MATLVLALSTTDTVEAEQHGGLIGAYARTLLEHLVGGVGVSILIALGTLAAIVLLTGASVGLVMRRSGQHVARAAGAGARLGGEVARRYRERPTGPPTLTAVPGGAGKRSKKAPAPLDGSQEYSDLFGDVPEFEIPGDEPESLPEVLEGAEPVADAQEPPAEPEDDVPPDEAVTAEVSLEEPAEQLPLDTVSARPAVEYRLPSPASSSAARRAAVVGQDHQRLSRQLVETLSNFGIEARVIGMVSGAAGLPLRAAAGAGHQGEPRAPAAR